MKRFSMTLVLALAALSLLAVATPARGGDRPIRASGSGAINWLTARLHAEEDVMHVGDSRVEFFGDQSWLDNNIVYLLQINFFAPNGDVLCAIVESQTFDPSTGILVATISFRASFSHGRFDDVVGSADLLIVFEDFESYGNPSFGFILDGVIDY